MDIKRLKEAAEAASAARMRATLNLEHAQAQLKELGYDTVDEAEAALDRINEQARQLEAEINNETAKLQDDYPELADL